MIQGMAIQELDDPNGAEQLNVCGYCAHVDVDLGEGRTWRIYVKGTGELAADSLEAQLIRATAQLVAGALAEPTDEVEPLPDTDSPVVEAASVASAEDAANPQPPLVRRVRRIRRVDPFGYHDHGPIQGGNCKPFMNLHHADCGSLFSNSNEGDCLSIENNMFRCWHGTT